MNSATEYATGGCQCGGVRLRVTDPLGRANICHCRMCQRATGNAFAPLVTARGVTFNGKPGRFASSDVAERGFCSNCGTPLVYASIGADGLELPDRHVIGDKRGKAVGEGEQALGGDHQIRGNGP